MWRTNERTKNERTDRTHTRIVSFIVLDSPVSHRHKLQDPSLMLWNVDICHVSPHPLLQLCSLSIVSNTDKCKLWMGRVYWAPSHCMYNITNTPLAPTCKSYYYTNGEIWISCFMGLALKCRWQLPPRMILLMMLSSCVRNGASCSCRAPYVTQF